MLSKEINEYKAEICDLKYKLEEMIKDQKDLIYKYEMTEKFWGNKCEKMEKDQFELTNQTKSQKKEIKRIFAENSALKSDLELMKKENKGFLYLKFYPLIFFYFIRLCIEEGT